MQSVYLIACSQRKRSAPCRARDLYAASPLFRLSLQFAEKHHPDQIFILSAKYGLVALDQEIAPYDHTLSIMSGEEVSAWSAGVLQQLQNEVDPATTVVTFLAGKLYGRPLAPFLPHTQLPLEGLGIGKRLQYLKSHLNS